MIIMINIMHSVNAHDQPHLPDAEVATKKRRKKREKTNMKGEHIELEVKGVCLFFEGEGGCSRRKMAMKMRQQSIHVYL